MKQVSAGEMLEALVEYLDTGTFTDWEEKFLRNVSKYNKDTTTLSGAQIEVIDKLYNRSM